MSAILEEGALFVALVAALCALLYVILMQFTPLGTRVRQIRNRRRLELDAACTCARHGHHAPGELVRLPSGDALCPECYAEIVHD